MKKADWLTPIMIAVALAIFLPLFAVKKLGPLDFFGWMSVNAVVLTTMVASLDSSWRGAIAADLKCGLPAKFLLGAASATVLYAIFFAGNIVSRLILPFAGGDIQAVYGLKDGVNMTFTAVLIAAIIGPGEELFWRVFVQRRLSARFGGWIGLCGATAVYTIMHVTSGNLMLMAAAAVCGLYWGLVFKVTGSVVVIVVSHILWDLSVFVFFPYR